MSLFVCLLASPLTFAGIFPHLVSLLIGCVLAFLLTYLVGWLGLPGLLGWFGSIGLLGSIGFPGLLDMPGLLDFNGFWRNRLA